MAQRNTIAKIIARELRRGGSLWICEHCGKVIEDKKVAWSRKGYHFHSKDCFEQTAQEQWWKDLTKNPPPKRRKP